MSYSETSFQNWIQAQMEPDGIIIVGKMKREPLALKEWISRADDKVRSIEQEEADNKRQDEYLAKYGIF